MEVHSMIQEIILTPIRKQCNVLVCGGGIAGISAALAAVRLGKKVILLEKEYLLGGLGTAGLVTIYLPICDGMGRQVSFGIAEELLRLSISMGAESLYPANWLDSTDPTKRTANDSRFEVRYNPGIFAILAEQLLLNEGAEIMYGTYAVSTALSDGRIKAVICENKSGRFAIEADSVVDATGDCDIAHFAGAPTETFRQGNVLASWYYFLGKNGYDLRTLGYCDVPDEDKKKLGSVETLVSERFTGLDGDEISRMVQLSHKSVLNDVKKRRETDPALVPTSIASIPQLRMTRKISGMYTLATNEAHRYFEDSVGMVSDWKKRGPVYEVPFGTLYSDKIRNLITAGRCTSVTEGMWDIMRVIPCCAVTGQAAGTAAALTDDFTALDIRYLQSVLHENGVKLHESELG